MTVNNTIEVNWRWLYTTTAYWSNRNKMFVISH